MEILQCSLSNHTILYKTDLILHRFPYLFRPLFSCPPRYEQFVVGPFDLRTKTKKKQTLSLLL